GRLWPGRQRRDAGASEQHSRRRRDVRPYEQREREQEPGAECAAEAIARSLAEPAEQQHEGGEKEDIGGGSANPRAAHLTYCTWLEPNTTPTGMAADPSVGASAQVNGIKRRNRTNT